MIKKCSQAPYGKGTETLVDTKVRRVWELDPEKFKLTNPKWDDLVSSITDEARVALGLEDTKLAARLYKLLVYEKGSFFLSHRDGEKLDGMVATLVIGLPSPHTGGKLIITHEGKRHEIAFTGAASGHELSYVAFYADCEHEVKPIRDGYRLCLVYNLALARSRRKTGISAPRTTPVVASISELLADWPSDEEITKLAVTLEHQYTPEGLSIGTLKGVDQARADVLFAAAEQAGCVAHLALITHWESGVRRAAITAIPVVTATIGAGLTTMTNPRTTIPTKVQATKWARSTTRACPSIIGRTVRETRSPSARWRLMKRKSSRIVPRRLGPGPRRIRRLHRQRRYDARTLVSLRGRCHLAQREELRSSVRAGTDAAISGVKKMVSQLKRAGLRSTRTANGMREVCQRHHQDLVATPVQLPNVLGKECDRPLGFLGVVAGIG